MTPENSVHTVHHPDVDSDPNKSNPVVIPGPSEEVARAIGSVSPEGRPADAKVGPAGLHWLLVIAGLVILITSAVVGLVFDPAAGLVMLSVGGLAFAFSPGFFVAFARAHERTEVAKTMSDRIDSHPDVVRLTEPRQPRH